MQQQSKWINEETACEWLGVSTSFLRKHRVALKVNFTYLITAPQKRCLMYDQASIEMVLETNAAELLIQQVTSK